MIKRIWSKQLHSAFGRRYVMTSTHIIAFAVAALLACGGPSWGTESTVAPAPATRNAETVPLYTNLGSHTKRISTNVAATQQYFDQGLRLVYGFNHAEAIRSFTRAAELDPTCAMVSRGEKFTAVGQTRLLRLERHGQAISKGTNHLYRY